MKDKVLDDALAGLGIAADDKPAKRQPPPRPVRPPSEPTGDALSDSVMEALGIDDMPRQVAATPARQVVSFRPRDYPALRTISRVYYALAVLVALGFGISEFGLIFNFTSSPATGLSGGAFVAAQAALIVSCVSLILTFVAIAEAIRLGLDIQNNTHAAAHFSEQTAHVSRILGFAVIASALAFPTAGFAQSPLRRINPLTARPTRFEGVDVGAVDRSPSSDSYYQPAIYKSDLQLERERVLAMRQASRDAAKERRERTWATLPFKFYSDEELARSKYNVAHLLWLNGCVDSSQRILQQLIDDYPDTSTADLAKNTLERF